MKNFIVSLALLALCLQTSVSAQSILAVSGTETRVISLSQPNTELQLEHQETEAVFTTQTVPDTCHRDVQRGTRKECATEYDQKCRTSNENQCHPEAYPVCRNVQQNVCNAVSVPVCQNTTRRQCDEVPRRVCETVQRNQCTSVLVPVCSDVPTQVCENTPTRECHDTSVPVCQNVPRSVCETSQQCETVQDSVCRGEVCEIIPRRQCKPLESCRTVSDSVCHDESRNICSNVNHQTCRTDSQRQCRNEARQECHSVPDSVCHTVNDSVCRTVPDSVCRNESRQDCHVETQNQCHNEYRQACAVVPVEHCEDIPRQVCTQVPNIVDEAYACTRNVQIKTGDRVTALTIAQVKISVSNFAGVDLSKESFRLSLLNNDVSLKLESTSSQYVVRVAKKDQQVQSINEVEKRVVVTFTLEFISVEQLTALSQIRMSTPVVYFDKVMFTLEGGAATSLSLMFESGHLAINQKKRLFGYFTAADQDFDGRFVSRVGDHFEIELQALGLGYLRSSPTNLELSLMTKSIFNRAELLNPLLVESIKLPKLIGSFSGYPISE